MTPDPGPDITDLLERIRDTDPNARDELLTRLYDELRRMAAALLVKEPAGHTLQSAALLNEALQRLLGNGVLERSPDRRYLFAAVHKSMCQVLTDYARRRIAGKRGGASRRVPLDDALDRVQSKWDLGAIDLIAINEALEQLERRSERQRTIVDLKIFCGLSNREVAEQLEISEATVEREFRVARAFLSRQLAG
jgi:RNA polymerase sigma factor (TIGR02999 family)